MVNGILDRAAVKVVDGGRGGDNGGGRVKLVSGDEEGDGQGSLGDGAVRFVFAFL